MIYIGKKEYALFYGKCEDELKRLRSESIDCMVTDPPYGLVSRGAKTATGGFMGKEWDKAVPSVKVWKECLRLLKPGAFAFIMSIPRQDCLARMIVNLGDAGFDVSYSPIIWTFASGFPKAQNVGKVVDKRLGMEREVVGKNENIKGRKDGGIWGNNIERPWKERVRSGEYNNANITTSTSLEAKALDGAYSGFQAKPCYEVILVAQKPFTDKHKRSDVYKMLGGRYDYWYTQRTVVTKDNKAKLLNKWNRLFAKDNVIERRLALVPELQDEVILNRERVLWSKSYSNSDLTSTITQALATGNGITWLDRGRIPYEGNDDIAGWQKGNYSGNGEVFAHGNNQSSVKDAQGRFSPNLLVSDDVLNNGKILKSSGHFPSQVKAEGIFRSPQQQPEKFLADSGSYSRYFSLDSWADRNLPESAKKTFPFMIVPKPSKREKNEGLDELEDKQMYYEDGRGNSLECFGSDKRPGKAGRNPRKNNHPTVKSITLMSYLIAIGSRPGDMILDPYIGSGTTAIAAVISDRRCIGIEMDEYNCMISKKRIEWHLKQKRDNNEH